MHMRLGEVHILHERCLGKILFGNRCLDNLYWQGNVASLRLLACPHLTFMVIATSYVWMIEVEVLER